MFQENPTARQGMENKMEKHPNEFTRRQIARFFSDRGLEVDVNPIERGYVIFFARFSPMEARTVDEPAGRLIYHPGQDGWSLYWMSGRFRWHLYDRFPRLHQALAAMSSEQAAHLFHKVL